MEVRYGGRRFGVCNSVNFLMSQKFHRIVMLLFLFCCWRTTILPLHEHTYGEAKRKKTGGKVLGFFY